MKRTEYNKLVLYNSKESFLPAKNKAFSTDWLVEVKDDNNIILPFALSYGNKQLYGILIPLNIPYSTFLCLSQEFEFLQKQQHTL